MQRAALLALAGTLGFGAVAPGQAAPVPSAAAAIGKTGSSAVIDVRWWGYGPGPYYYGPRGYYGPRYYGPPVVYAPPPVVYGPPSVVYARPPVVYAPPPQMNGPVRQCWVTTNSDHGYGYWQPC